MAELTTCLPACLLFVRPIDSVSFPVFSFQVFCLAPAFPRLALFFSVPAACGMMVGVLPAGTPATFGGLSCVRNLLRPIGLPFARKIALLVPKPGGVLALEKSRRVKSHCGRVPPAVLSCDIFLHFFPITNSKFVHKRDLNTRTSINSSSQAVKGFQPPSVDHFVGRGRAGGGGGGYPEPTTDPRIMYPSMFSHQIGRPHV